MSSISIPESSLITDIERYDFRFVKGSHFARSFLPTVMHDYLHESEMEPTDLDEPDLVINDAFDDPTYEENWNINLPLVEEEGEEEGEEVEDEGEVEEEVEEEVEDEGEEVEDDDSSVSDAFVLHGPALPRVEERFKQGRHYMNNGVVELSRRFKVVHKLVDLARYFIIKNRYCFPYIIVKFRVVRKDNGGYDFRVILTNCFNRFRFVFMGANCLKQLAFYLLRYNRFAWIFNVFIEGFLFQKLRVVLEHFSPLLSFEVFASCSVKHRESYPFSNQFGVIFVCHIKKDAGHTHPFVSECYYRYSSISVTELYNCSMPMFVLYFFRNQGYRIFQDNWKFFSDIFSNSFIRNNSFCCFKNLRFHLLANLSMTADTSKKTVSIRLSGIMNSYCKIFPSTPVDSFSQDFRKFKGGVVFVKFLYFLVFSSELYDCDYCFRVFGLGFFNQIGRSLSLYPHVFGVISPISAGDSISRFRLEMPSGRVHDFVQRDDCFSTKSLFSLPWFKSVLRMSEEECEKYFDSSYSLRIQPKRGVKRKVDYCEV